MIVAGHVQLHNTNRWRQHLASSTAMSFEIEIFQLVRLYLRRE